MSPYYLIKPGIHYMVVDVRSYLYWIAKTTNGRYWFEDQDPECLDIWFPVGWKY